MMFDQFGADEITDTGGDECKRHLNRSTPE